jgi:hypothetical protein
MKTSPCKNCICLPICRQKILASKGSTLYAKIWTFAYSNKTCSLLKDYIKNPSMDISLHKSSILLWDLQILGKGK